MTCVRCSRLSRGSPASGIWASGATRSGCHRACARRSRRAAGVGVAAHRRGELTAEGMILVAAWPERRNSRSSTCIGIPVVTVRVRSGR